MSWHVASVSRMAGCALALIALSCGSSGGATAPPDPAGIPAPSAIAFVDVRIVAMTSPDIVDHQTVLVRDGRIERIEPTGTAPLPGDVVVIEGRGRYLAPALIDMHVHARGRDLPAYLRAGIGTVRNMWGHSGIPGLVTAINDGSRAGPSIYSTGPGLDASPPQWPETQLLESVDVVDSTVSALVAAGWRTMKVYQRLSAPVYDAIIDAARRHGAYAVGHVPTAITVQHALASGQRSIEHLSGYERALSPLGRLGTSGWLGIDDSRISSLVGATVAAGTWNCPTMAIYARLANQHPASDRPTIIANRRRFLKALHDAGARLLAGTDAGIDVVDAGSSIHDELAEFVAAGLTPYQALRAATIDAGTFLEEPGLGTITVGAPAQIMLLDANPLADIGNARRLAGIVVRGEWYSVAALSALVQ